MPADLDRVVSTDEECRSRVLFARKQIEREIEAARAARTTELARKQQAAESALNDELASIRAEGEKVIAERRAALEAYLSHLATSGEETLEAAAQLYARIIVGAEEKSE